MAEGATLGQLNSIHFHPSVMEGRASHPIADAETDRVPAAPISNSISSSSFSNSSSGRPTGKFDYPKAEERPQTVVESLLISCNGLLDRCSGALWAAIQTAQRRRHPVVSVDPFGYGHQQNS